MTSELEDTTQAADETLVVDAGEVAGVSQLHEALSEPHVPLRFVDVVVLLPNTNPIVILEELGAPNRQLRIPVGTSEGVAIAFAAKKIATPRPLTHELFTDALQSYAIALEVVRITEVHNNAFVAEMVVSGPTGSRLLSCRPSDGIALALRQRLEAPITAATSVLDQVGVANS